MADDAGVDHAGWQPLTELALGRLDDERVDHHLVFDANCRLDVTDAVKRQHQHQPGEAPPGCATPPAPSSSTSGSQSGTAAGSQASASTTSSAAVNNSGGTGSCLLQVFHDHRDDDHDRFGTAGASTSTSLNASTVRRSYPTPSGFTTVRNVST